MVEVSKGQITHIPGPFLACDPNPLTQKGPEGMMWMRLAFGTTEPFIVWTGCVRHAMPGAARRLGVVSAGCGRGTALFQFPFPRRCVEETV